jgi:hypothetical protein
MVKYHTEKHTFFNAQLISASKTATSSGWNTGYYSTLNLHIGNNSSSDLDIRLEGSIDASSSFSELTRINHDTASGVSTHSVKDIGCMDYLRLVASNNDTASDTTVTVKGKVMLL